MLGNAAGKDDVLELLETAIIDQRRRHHERTGHRRVRSSLNCLEKNLRHIGAEIFFHLVRDRLADLDLVAKLLHHRPAGVFDAGDLVILVEGDQPGADANRRGLRHHAVFHQVKI